MTIHNYATHATHSNLVRFWRAKPAKDAFSEEVMAWEESPICALRSPADGHTIWVGFSSYPDHPEYVRIRSTNWRCEYEPNGCYAVADARAFWTKLRKAGFDGEEKIFETGAMNGWRVKDHADR